MNLKILKKTFKHWSL